MADSDSRQWIYYLLMLTEMKDVEIYWNEIDMLRYVYIYDIHLNYAITMNIVEIGINIMRKKRRDWVSAQPLRQQRRQCAGDRDICCIGFRKSKYRLYFDGI